MHFRKIMAVLRLLLGGLAVFYATLIVLFAFFPVFINIYQFQEYWRLGALKKDWVAMEDIAPVMARAVVAAEDANFCLHWGFDMQAIRLAMVDGRGRGASTISQQTVKNVLLWQKRSWVRKALEGALTPAVELVWTKRRILHVYLNVAEFGEGIFGVEAAAQHYFGVPASRLKPVQAARLAAILPDPKHRNPVKPGAFVKARAKKILAGVETITKTQRDSCFVSY